MAMKQKRFNNFDSLKSIAYIFIILNHVGFKYLKFGGFGVSVFLILSGFLLMNKYYDSKDMDNYSIKDSIGFAINKIKPLYLLHFFCVIVYIPTLFLGSARDSITTVFYKVLTNVLLIQEWFPLSHSSMNECSWYLSAIVFCYFMFPLLLNNFKKNEIKKPFLYIVIIFLFQIIIAFMASYFFTDKGAYIRYWLTYRFPLTRFLDFLIGCLLYIAYKNSKIKQSSVRYLEYGGIFLSILAFIMIILNIGNVLTSNYFFQNNNTILYTAIFTPGVCLLVYSLAFDKGILFSFLYRKPFMFISKYGKYIFLIHYLVFDLIRIGLTIFATITLKHGVMDYLPYVNCSFGIILTFCLSKKMDDLYKYLETKF